MLLGLAVLWIVIAVVAAIVAENKNRSSAGWLCTCLFLSPAMILILLALPNRSDPRYFNEQAVVTTKTCPQCAETVKAKAKICRFCRYEFASSAIEDAHRADERGTGTAVAQPNSKPPSLAQDKAPTTGTISVVQEKDKRFSLATIFAVVVILVGISALAFITRLDNLARGAPPPVQPTTRASPVQPAADSGSVYAPFVCVEGAPTCQMISATVYATAAQCEEFRRQWNPGMKGFKTVCLSRPWQPGARSALPDPSMTLPENMVRPYPRGSLF
jgi:hypothetical protein